VITYLPYVLRATLRRSRLLYALSLAGVALGVASVVSIRIINSNAVGAFTGTVRAVSGDADVSIIGLTPTFPSEILPRVLATPGVEGAWPILSMPIVRADDPNFRIELVGLDVFAPHPFPIDIVDGELSDALFRPGWVAVSPRLARKEGWRLGDSVRVASGASTVTLHIGAFVDFERVTPLASPRLAVMDLAQVQSLFGREGRLTEINASASPGSTPGELRARLERILGGSVRVTTPRTREVEAQDLLAAFRLNLTALSLISVFVGGFLVMTATRATLVRRRREFGLLRAIGATRLRVALLVLIEVVVLALAGAAAGIPLGVLAANTQLDRVNATLTNIYLLTEVHATRIAPRDLAGAAFIGLTGALVAAVGPIIDMSRREVRLLLSAFTLHERLGERAGRLALVGLGGIAMAGVWYAFWGRGVRPAGFILSFAVLGAIPACVPALLQHVCRRVPLRAFDASMSARNIVRRLATTSVAVSALAAAVSMLVGVTIMVASFRQTLVAWLDQTLRADVYVSPAAWVRGGDTAVLTPEVIERLRVHPGVRAIDELRQLRLTTDRGRLTLGGVRFGLPVLEKSLPMLEGDARAVEVALRQEGSVAVSEPLARKLHLSVGGSLEVPTSDGPARLPIVGIYYDYVSEAGSALTSLATLEKLFGPGPIQNVALYVDRGQSAQALADAVATSTSELPLEIRSNRDLKRKTMVVFDETFAVTRTLQWMALAVAVTGVALTLLVLARERLAELALFRALGAVPRQVLLLFLGEGVALGLFGIFVGVIGGVAFALLLIYEINRAYFGWTIQPSWPIGTLLVQMLVVLGATVLASLYPAILASRTRAIELSREDV
jgi:putative ABC transport system permease protein